MTLAFKVEGLPAPQGSKTGRSYCGQAAKVCPACHRPHLVNINMVESSAKLKPWRALVVAKARFATGPGWPVMTGPVTVNVRFALKRPKSHYRTGKYADLLRDDAPPVPYNTNGLDVDKLGRGILDALTIAQVYDDDSQVVRLVAEKVYAGPDQPVEALIHPGALILVTEWQPLI